MLVAALFTSPFSGALAETWKIPGACKAVASVLKEGRNPLSDGAPLVTPIKVKKVSASDLKSILPEKDFEEIEKFPYIATARFDYDGDGINDLIIRLGDGGTAECEYWQIYKGVRNSKRVVYGIPPYDEWGTSDSFCRQENEFVRIGKRIYHLIAAPSYPDAPDDGYRVFELGHQAYICKITDHWDWKHAAVMTDACEDEAVCAAVKAQAHKLVGDPGTMLAGKQMPRIECDSEDGGWGKGWFGGWKVDMDNDGTEEFYARMTENYGGYSEYYMDARTPEWSECGKGFSPSGFDPEERWRFESKKLSLSFWSASSSEKNFIRVASKNYWLVIYRGLKTNIQIVLIEHGVARQVGAVTVGPPKISVKIERY